jgi:hypothetical protein
MAFAWPVLATSLLLPAAVVPMHSATAQSPSPAILAEGRLRGIAHEAKGTATLLRLENGKRVLRLREFETLNGPDLYVYLVAAPDASDNETVTKSGFVSLGRLKAPEGDQDYDVPARLDLGKYRSVSIWCRLFSVNFAAASLAPPRDNQGR